MWSKTHLLQSRDITQKSKSPALDESHPHYWISLSSQENLLHRATAIKAGYPEALR